MATRLSVVTLMLLACAAEDDKAPGTWTPGKGDGTFELVEAGPAPLDGRVELHLDGRVPAYRVESFGGTQVTITLGSKSSDAYVIVEGPLASDGDRTAVGAGAVIGEDDDSGDGRDAKLDLTLAQPGVYRILTGTYESLGAGGEAAGSLTLGVTCRASCFRPMLDQKTFMRALQQQAGATFAEYAKNEIASLVHDPATAEQMSAQLAVILADPQLTGLERFPTIPLAAIGALRPALGQIPASPPNEDQVVRGELVQLLGGCTPDRALPAEIDARVPGVRYGHFPSKTLSPCQFAHASTLAQVLTSLAAQNGSSVTFKGQTIESPRELFAALVASGHTIQVRNERMYANFLSMIAGDRDVIWPVWLDTGIRLSDGETLSVPMGHSHHAWRISGPNINTRVMFYLGVSGAGFFGQLDQRPAWSGMVATTDVTVAAAQGADFDYLLKTVDTAATYLRRIRVERTTVAAGKPADGYGFLGVCNDSNAVIEYTTRGTISTFPLLRAKQLDALADLGDGLDATIELLPKDGDGLTDRRDALRRTVAMQPFADGSPLIWDTQLGAQLARARAELGQ